MMTPRIPNRGRVEMSEGIAAAVACAISVGLGRRVGIVVEAMMLRLSSRANGGNDREARTQSGREVRVVERNLHGDSLYDFREIAGSVVRR